MAPIAAEEWPSARATVTDELRCAFGAGARFIALAISRSARALDAVRYGLICGEPPGQLVGIEPGSSR